MPDSMFGKSEECPFCSQRFMITNPPPEDASEPWVVHWMGHVDKGESSKSEKESPRIESFARWMTLVVLILGVIGCIAVYSFTRPTAPKAPEGFYETAHEIAKEFTDRNEKDEALSLIARSLAKHGDIKSADTFRKNIRNSEQRILVDIAIAEAKYHAGNAVEARQEFNTAYYNLSPFNNSRTGISPEFALKTGFPALANAQLRCDQPSMALNVIQHYDVHYIIEIHCNVADYHFARNDVSSAVSVLQSADAIWSSGIGRGFGVPVHQEDVDKIMLRLADGFRKTGGDPAVMNGYVDQVKNNLTVRKSSRDIGLWFALAEFYYNNGDKNEAELTLDAGRQAGLGLPQEDIELALAKYYRNTKQYEEAVKTAKTAIDSTFSGNPIRFDLIDFLARVYSETNENEKAVKLLDDQLEIVRSEAESSAFYLRIIDSYFTIGETNKAIQLFNDELEIFNNEEQFVLAILIAKSYRERGLDAEADDYFTQAVLIVPDIYACPPLPPSLKIEGDDQPSRFKAIFNVYDMNALQKTSTVTVPPNVEEEKEDDPLVSETVEPVIDQTEEIEFDDNPEKPNDTDSQPGGNAVPIKVRDIPVTPGVTDATAPAPRIVRPVPVRNPVPRAVVPAPPGVSDGTPLENIRPVPIRPVAPRAVKPTPPQPPRVVPGVTDSGNQDQSTPRPIRPQRIRRDAFGNPLPPESNPPIPRSGPRPGTPPGVTTGTRIQIVF